MRVQIAIPEPHVSKPVLDAGLEAVTRLNEQMIANGEVPSFERALGMGIEWKPEPTNGDEHFDSADKVIRRKWGDCDDMAPYHAASLRASGEDPDATAVVKRSGPKRWHAVVQRGDGSIDDPSLAAGMRAGVEPGVFGVNGAVVPLMLPEASPSSVVGSTLGAYLLRPQIAVRPVYGEYQARADLPWYWREHTLHDAPSRNAIAMTALHTAPVAQTALTGAINDVCELARCSGVGLDEHIDRLCAIADGCEGMSYDELREIYGDDHARAAAQVVGSFFGKLTRGLGRIAKGAVSFIPGVGPVANLALDAGSHLLHRSGPTRPAPTSPPAMSPAPMHYPSPAPLPRALPALARPVPARPAPQRLVVQPGDLRQPGLAAQDEAGASGRSIVVHFH
jgi:hypothetical protein